MSTETKIRVEVLLLQKYCSRGWRWCHPIGWNPSNKIDGLEYTEGVWWNADGEIAARLVWIGNTDNQHKAGAFAQVNISDLKVGSCFHFSTLRQVILES
jgi:hypothetical protein